MSIYVCVCGLVCVNVCVYMCMWVCVGVYLCLFTFIYMREVFIFEKH